MNIFVTDINPEISAKNLYVSLYLWGI